MGKVILREHILLLSGQHVEAAMCNTKGFGTPYLTGPSDFPNGQITVTKFTEYPKVICSAGDILITVKGSGVGSLTLADQPYCISRQLMAIQSISLDRNFVHFQLEFLIERFKRNAVGAIPGITREDILNIEIPSVPYKLQERIGKILGTWDSAIALTENLIAAKQKRKEFLLDYLLSKNAHNEWRKLKLAELSTKPISYGIVQTGEPVKRGIPCVRVVDLTARELKPQKMITTCEEISQSYKKTILEKGELMIALRGEIGLVRLVDEKLVGCNLTRGIARVSPDKRLVLPEYLLWAIRSPLFRNNLLRRVNGSALQEIPITELRKVIVPVPPIERQQVIANLLDTADYEIEIIQNLFNFLQTQKRGLMQNS
ncbi:MAG: hypothetical protein HC907_28060 [Richelia sp. SM1_7_0]|nr:hypothetical protein [Richelia sp. SM1_7_0]